MTKLIALLTVLAVMVGLSVLTSIYGWGLTPKNWWWIIGVGLFGQIFMKLIGDAVMNEKN